MMAYKGYLAHITFDAQAVYSMARSSTSEMW
jgi:hypothetical protein